MQTNEEEKLLYISFQYYPSFRLVQRNILPCFAIFFFFIAPRLLDSRLVTNNGQKEREGATSSSYSRPRKVAGLFLRITPPVRWKEARRRG